MSKEKLEKDFQDFNSQIDKMAEEEIKAIREKTESIKAEVSKIGDSVASSVDEHSEARKEKG